MTIWITDFVFSFEFLAIVMNFSFSHFWEICTIWGKCIILQQNISTNLGIWEFHTMYPNHTHFPFYLDPSSYSWTLCPTPKNTNLGCPYTHSSMIKLLLSSPLKKTEYFSISFLRSEVINCEIIFITMSSYLNWFYFLSFYGMGIGCHSKKP